MMLYCAQWIQVLKATRAELCVSPLDERSTATVERQGVMVQMVFGGLSATRKHMAFAGRPSGRARYWPRPQLSISIGV